MAAESANFEFLRSHDVQLVRLGALAERYFRDDPSTCLIKLRQFAEVLAQLTAARTGLFVSTEEAQADLLRRLKIERVISQEVADLFHQIRIVGNTKAVWVYDLRANMNSFGKTRLLTVADFAEFETAFGDAPLGKAKRIDQGEEGRFRCFTREQISDRNDNLDIAWLRDTSNDPEDELTEPEEIAAAIATHLGNALREIERMMEEFTIGGEPR
jgi:hypothetical protein